MASKRARTLRLNMTDFMCLAKRLIVEIDGGHHGGKRDAIRDAWLESR